MALSKAWVLALTTACLLSQANATVSRKGLLQRPVRSLKSWHINDPESAIQQQDGEDTAPSHTATDEAVDAQPQTTPEYASCGIMVDEYEFGNAQEGRISVVHNPAAGAPLTSLTVHGQAIPIEAFTELSIGLEEGEINVEYHAMDQDFPQEQYRVISGAMVATATIKAGQKEFCLNVAGEVNDR